MEPAQRRINRQYDEYWEMVLNSPNKKILVIDDDPEALRYLTRILMHAEPGAVIVTANSVEEAREIAGEAKFDFAIIDYVLSPTTNGLDLCREIKRKNEATECLIVSSLPRHQYQELATDWISVPDFLQKPFTADSLLKHIS